MKHLAFTLFICVFLVSCGQKDSNDISLDRGATDIIETTQETNF